MSNKRGRESIGEVIDSYVFAALIALPTLALLYYGLDSAICATLKLTTAPPAPFNVAGEFIGLGESEITTQFHGGCARYTEYGIDDGDPNTPLFMNALGEWKGSLPPVGTLVAISSPTGRAKDVTIKNLQRR